MCHAEAVFPQHGIDTVYKCTINNVGYVTAPQTVYLKARIIKIVFLAVLCV
jgi:hypothetical protein